RDRAAVRKPHRLRAQRLARRSVRQRAVDRRRRPDRCARLCPRRAVEPHHRCAVPHAEREARGGGLWAARGRGPAGGSLHKAGRGLGRAPPPPGGGGGGGGGWMFWTTSAQVTPTPTPTRFARRPSPQGGG